MKTEAVTKKARKIKSPTKSFSVMNIRTTSRYTKLKEYNRSYYFSHQNVLNTKTAEEENAKVFISFVAHNINNLQRMTIANLRKDTWDYLYMKTPDKLCENYLLYL